MFGDNVNIFSRKLSKDIFSTIAVTEKIMTLYRLEKSDGHEVAILEI